MALHHYAAYKLGAWGIGLGMGAIFAFVEKGATSDLKIALIGGGIATLPPTILGFFNLIQQQRGFNEQRRDRLANTKQLTDVGQKVDGILSTARQGEQAALKRADFAEGRQKGVEAEQDRPK
jgi:hypothetical protein